MAQTDPKKKHIVILGGSFGGLSVAHYVLRHVIPKLPTSKNYDVVLVSASPEAMLRQAAPRALISDHFFPQDKLFIPVAKQFDSYPHGQFRFVHGTAKAVDPTGRSVTVSIHNSKAAASSDQEEVQETIPFHALVIATGASTASPLLGLNTDAASLRASWATFRAALPTARSIVIAGGGPSGVEVAGELGEYLNGRHPGSWFSSPKPPKVSITLVTAAAQILPHLRPAIAQQAETFLSHLGVTVVKNTKITDVAYLSSSYGSASELSSKATVTLSDGHTLTADLYIPCVGIVANTSFIPSNSNLLAPDGRVLTNPSTLRVDSLPGVKGIYAIGDASTFARQAAHSIQAAVPILCANLKRDLLEQATGKKPEGEDRVFKEVTKEMQLVPIGTSKGVGAIMGFRLPSFFVWLMKGRDYWMWTTKNTWNGEQWAKES
ncbi:hypothetical protein B0H63DRAFT_462830 [Podospora didyma]|uniref:FAD/NAD(P)-binding domain-containing protein n=1 Tax=Podospora didyma TaxID=330526 RepID=A0AAE0P8E2_9PEZI|nr:hypothetical protein B0H63DRAFT_462830 [Podospora didyma]